MLIKPLPTELSRFVRESKHTGILSLVVGAAFVASFVLGTQGGLFSFTEQVAARVVTISGAETEYNSQNVPLLTAANHIDPNPSKGGGGILVVDGSALKSEVGPQGTEANIEERPESDQISLYVVREGDTLSQIGEMFGVNPSTIIWASGLKRGAHIEPGQTLTILPVNGIKHVVEDGDTLLSIAEEYEGDAEEISIYNDLPIDAVLAVGTEVIVPGGELHGGDYSDVQVVSSSAPSFTGYFIKPTQGVITQGLHGFNAVDFGASCGTPVVASASGNVILVRTGGWNGGYGNYIVIRHNNGTQTLYSHNSANLVYVGQQVQQGQVIGYIGSTGRSTGCHVHFEVRGATNPFAY